MKADFGTYHHTTPRQSEQLREYAERAFSKLLLRLLPSGAKLKILDAGCGLGFLTYVAASCFPKAEIVGLDLFKHDSVSGLSMDRAAQNMKALGIDSRTSFFQHDLTKPMKSNARYDLALSNLVFHNMGKKRFSAYDTVFKALKPKGYFVIADLFPHNKTEMNYFLGRSNLIEEIEGSPLGVRSYKIKVLKKIN
jgi:cyclopropane fatty-acyl-phospholipid synthase-like methyltransferase